MSVEEEARAEEYRRRLLRRAQSECGRALLLRGSNSARRALQEDWEAITEGRVVVADNLTELLEGDWDEREKRQQGYEYCRFVA